MNEDNQEKVTLSVEKEDFFKMLSLSIEAAEDVIQLRIDKCGNSASEIRQLNRDIADAENLIELCIKMGLPYGFFEKEEYEDAFVVDKSAIL